jgi:hypothetical protein
LWSDDGLIGAETCSHFDKQIKKPTYTSCVLTVNFNPNYIFQTQRGWTTSRSITLANPTCKLPEDDVLTPKHVAVILI